MMDACTLFTVGHSQRSIGDLLALLKIAQITCVVDVRAVPRSARYPHFGQDALRTALNAAQISYRWAGRTLGGRRNAQSDSPHVALTHAAWRGYADHMDTGEFRRGLAQLLSLAQREPVAILCAEHLPENCHRRLIADAVLLHGMRVVHLLDTQRQREHVLSAEVRRESTKLIYDRHTTGSLNLQ